MSRHIENLHIHSFRGLKDVKLEGLGQVNLLVGGNNSGKTSVLEAIDLHCHPLDILRFVTISKRRDSEAVKMPTLETLRWMFPAGHEQKNDIRIESKTNVSRKVTKINYHEYKVIQHDEIKNISDQYDYFMFRLESAEEELARYHELLEINKDTLDEFMFEPEMNTVRRDIDRYKYKLKKLSDELVLANEPIEVFDVKMEVDQFEENALDNSEHELFTVSNFSSINQGNKKIEYSPTVFVTPIDHRSLSINSKAITNSIFDDQDFKVIELLRLFDSDIMDVQILAPDGKVPVPYLTHNRLGRAPSSVFGDGVRRAFTLATAVVNAKNGILLIDEVETAVHFNKFKKLFKWLVEACKQYNVQLVTTTHSLEAIDAILSSIDARNETEGLGCVEEFVTYKLETEDDAMNVVRFSMNELSDIRYHFGLDVR